MRLFSVAAALVAIACGPTVVLPGGELSGTVASGTVSDWSFSNDTSTVQLETRPSRPYSINVWGVSSGPAFYITSESWRTAVGLGDARWVGHIADDPRVRLRIGETIYERKAVRVQDGAELASVLTLFQKKYSSESTRHLERWSDAPEDWEGVRVFRLDPR